MVIRYCFIIIILFAINACVSNKSFNNEQAFATYISQLHLSNLTMETAVLQLESKGFHCYPHDKSFSCTRTAYPSWACNERQFIELSPQIDYYDPIYIETKLGLVCI